MIFGYLFDYWVNVLGLVIDLFDFLGIVCGVLCLCGFRLVYRVGVWVCCLGCEYVCLLVVLSVDDSGCVDRFGRIC